MNTDSLASLTHRYIGVDQCVVSTVDDNVARLMANGRNERNGIKWNAHIAPLTSNKCQKSFFCYCCATPRTQASRHQIHRTVFFFRTFQHPYSRCLPPLRLLPRNTHHRNKCGKTGSEY